MRTLLAVALAICLTQIVAWGQQTSAQKAGPAMLLKQLNSDEPIVRDNALKELRHNPPVLRDPRIKSALVNLLDRENHVTLDSDDEGYAEYVGWLTEAVVSPSPCRVSVRNPSSRPHKKGCSQPAPSSQIATLMPLSVVIPRLAPR
jgi:hypothetical protein